MTGIVDTEFLLRVLSIVAIDLTVSGENALVIALAVRHLSPRQAWHGRIWGTAGAVLLRLVFIVAVTYLLGVPFLQLVGGVLLLGIAVKLVRQPASESATHVRAASSLPGAIWTIVVADAVMSLDNVLAVAGAAHGDFPLALFGVALSLPIVVWGSGLVSRLMSRWPGLVVVGAGILGFVAGEMILAEPVIAAWIGESAPMEIGVPLVLALGVAAFGWHGRPAAPRPDAARR